VLFHGEWRTELCTELSNVSQVFETPGSLLSAHANFLSYTPLLGGFESATHTLWDLYDAFVATQANCSDSTLTGMFTENQDNSRFAAATNDMQLAKNAASFTMLSDGIPIIYNGQEQHFSGVSQNGQNREAIWLTGYDTTAPLYTHIAMLNKIRNWFVAMANEEPYWSGYWKFKCSIIYSDDHVLALRKGVAGYRMVSITNNYGTATKTYVSLPSSFAPGHDRKTGEQRDSC
jgi:alpha-amylase